ncbi:MAG: electron transport complex subunit RsxA [Candidatus Delongbacteria bacterium]|nr:electron transport complex subunit RsxA [Candidatus Delongbacteria bacterium]
MEFDKLFVIIIGSIFVYNVILSRFMGICPYLGVSKQLSSAFGMGAAVIFVLTLSSAVTYLIYIFFLAPVDTNIWYILFGSGKQPADYDFTYLRTIVFILIIAALVQLVEMIIQKISPSLYKALGIYLPLITTNCAVLGVAVLNISEGYNFIEGVVHGAAVGVGFTLVLILMAGIRERLELIDIPRPFKGITIAFILAGLMSMSFLGFAGLKL